MFRPNSAVLVTILQVVEADLLQDLADLHPAAIAEAAPDHLLPVDLQHHVVLDIIQEAEALQEVPTLQAEHLPGLLLVVALTVQLRLLRDQLAPAIIQIQDLRLRPQVALIVELRLHHAQLDLVITQLRQLVELTGQLRGTDLAARS